MGLLEVKEILVEPKITPGMLVAFDLHGRLGRRTSLNLNVKYKRLDTNNRIKKMPGPGFLF